VEEQSPVFRLGVGWRLGRAWDGVGVVHRPDGGVCTGHSGEQAGYGFGVTVSILVIRVGCIRVSVEMDRRRQTNRQ
jgi:hypothetical protein